MPKNEKRVLRWVRLDNAAKIYPAARRRNWSNVYRQSVTLCENVDKAVLQSALDVTAKRFPSIAARLRRGLFWFYLQQVDEAPKIRHEQSYPLVFMSNKEMQKCALRVIAYRNRIAVEYFHSLTDGTGALIFLKTLTAEYLEQKYGISIPCEDGILDRREPPSKEELEDSFLRYTSPVAASRRSANAWRPAQEPTQGGFLNLTCFSLPVQDALSQARARGTSLTVFLGAAMMQALQSWQAECVPQAKKRKRIKLLIPVNLRNLFPSKTLRNFAMYTIPELDTRLGEYSFEEICKVIQSKMGAEITAKHMSTVITTNVKDERNPLVRLIPLPLKNLVMRENPASRSRISARFGFPNACSLTLHDSILSWACKPPHRTTAVFSLTATRFISTLSETRRRPILSATSSPPCKGSASRLPLKAIKAKTNSKGDLYVLYSMRR